MSRVLYIVGPTASGKTGLAIRIAKKYNGEIICADSRTIYKGLDIGTAKPSEVEREGIKHYGLDLIEPCDSFSAAEFTRKANAWVSDISKRGKLPIIVGGTGLYIDAMFYGFSFTEKANQELRSKLENLGVEELQNIIRNNNYKMPENLKNKRYLIRAIEREGKLGAKKTPDKDAVIVGINPDKEALRSRIRERALLMHTNGVIEEAKDLYRKYGEDSPGASGNIYRSLIPYFNKQESLGKCLSDFETLDWRLAKRQITWFKRNEYIKWFNSDSAAEQYLLGIL